MTGATGWAQILHTEYDYVLCLKYLGVDCGLGLLGCHSSYNSHTGEYESDNWFVVFICEPPAPRNLLGGGGDTEYLTIWPVVHL